MTLDITTFILQIVNFLVLLWLLHRFVYAPLRKAIAKRQADAAVAEAVYQQKLQALEVERVALQQKNNAADKAKQVAEARLAEEMVLERAHRMTVLEKELKAAREQGLARIETQMAAQITHAKTQLQHQVDEVLRTHLLRLASPAFEAVLLDRFIADVDQLDATSRAELKKLSWIDSLDICTAFPVTGLQQGRVLAALGSLRGEPVKAQWKQDVKLIAGVRVGLDGKELELSLGRGLELLPPLVVARQQTNTSPG